MDSLLSPVSGYSRRSQDIAPFHVMALLARANALEQAGHDVIHLEIGEPDFTTAAPVVAAGQAALAAGHTRYTAARGLPALREAIAGFYAQRYGCHIDPERVLVTPGGSGALLLASSLLVDPSKHWLLADPGYPCNRHFLRLVEAGAQLVPVGPDSDYQLTPALVDACWTADSVGALVASPANPTGSVLSRAQLAALSQALQARGGHLVVDEIYHGLTYGLDAHSVLEVDDSAFVLNSFSKYFGMTGWRLGWLIAPPSAVPELENSRRTSTSAPRPSPSMRPWPASRPRASPSSKRAAPSSSNAAITCCLHCAHWASTSPSSHKARSICMPTSAHSPRTRRPSVRTSWKPSMLPSLPASTSASTAPTSTSASPIRRACRALSRRWSALRVGYGTSERRYETG